MKNKSLLLQLVKSMQPDDIAKEVSWFGHSKVNDFLYDGKTGCICGWAAIKTGLNPNDFSQDIHDHWEEKFGSPILGNPTTTELSNIHAKYAKDGITFEEMKEKAIKVVEGAE